MAAAVALAAGLLAGCGGDDAAAPAPQAAGHVHGLGLAESGGAVLVATHHGLFRVPAAGGEPAPVGRLRHDLMGFTVADDGRLLASGHPDPRADLPPHLGLVESGDGGATWTPVSLLGEADFHALDARGGRVVGQDATTGRLLGSRDGGRTWTALRAPGPLVDIALHPADPLRLVASTRAGLHATDDGGASWSRLAGPPGLLAWPAPGRLVGAVADGTVAVSGDGGRSWRAAGRAPVAAVALAAGDGRIVVAGADGSIVASDGRGARWRTIARLETDG